MSLYIMIIRSTSRSHEQKLCQSRLLAGGLPSTERQSCQYSIDLVERNIQRNVLPSWHVIQNAHTLWRNYVVSNYERLILTQHYWRHPGYWLWRCCDADDDVAVVLRHHCDVSNGRRVIYMIELRYVTTESVRFNRMFSMIVSQQVLNASATSARVTPRDL